ncbi:MAG: TerB family tellurite resistance protein [Proteobacteria bacterium]|nr:TerB family tellurite resistance protein [Pseudomonadota bacterium]
MVDNFRDVERVVADPLRFKLRLGIGEDAYASLKLKKAAQELWDVGGAAASGAGLAASPLVAGTFFAKAGILSMIGIGTAVTPVGWIVAAAVASGGAYYGVRRLFRGYAGSRVQTIPRFINTPIDVLGASLLDLIGGLAVSVARMDGHFSKAERASIAQHFTSEWGFDGAYVDQALTVIAASADGQSLKAAAASLARFQIENPDCNPDAMRGELIGFLREVAEADGVVDEREELAIEKVEAILLKETQFSIAKTRRNISSWSRRAGATLAKWAPRRLRT